MLAWETGFDLASSLVSNGLVPELRMAEVRRLARSRSQLLDEMLLSQGVLSEDSLARFYCSQFGYPFLAFEDLVSVLETDSGLGKLIPAPLATSGLVLPLGWDAKEGTLDIAVAFPTNRSLLELLLAFGPAKKLQISVAARSTLKAAIAAAYPDAGRAPSQSDPRQRPARVLLLEKNSEARSRWAGALRAAGQTIGEAESLHGLSQRLKVSEFDVVAACHRPDWQEVLAAVESSACGAEVRFAATPAEALLGETVPYPVMSAFFFATLRTVIRLFGRSHKVPSEAILAPPRVAREVADLLELPTREIDEVHFAAYLASIAQALGDDEVRFAESMEKGLTSPWRIRHLLASAAKAVPDRDAPTGSRVLRLVRTFLLALKKHGGKVPPAILECRGSAAPEDAPVVEALVAVLHREGLAKRADSGREAVVVDKDKKRAGLLEAALKNEGHRVRLFLDGRVADAGIALAPPDVVVAATAVPGLDGYSLCQSARRLGVPTFLVASQDIDAFARLRAQAVGAASLFDAPLDLSRLVDAVQKLLAAAPGKARARRCSGALSQLNARAVLALLSESHGGALVHFCSGGKLARVRVEGGAVSPLEDTSSATLDDVLTWTEGAFMVVDRPADASLAEEKP